MQGNSPVSSLIVLRLQAYATMAGWPAVPAALGPSECLIHLHVQSLCRRHLIVALSQDRETRQTRNRRFGVAGLCCLLAKMGLGGKRLLGVWVPLQSSPFLLRTSATLEQVPRWRLASPDCHWAPSEFQLQHLSSSPPSPPNTTLD